MRALTSCLLLPLSCCRSGDLVGKLASALRLSFGLLAEGVQVRKTGLADKTGQAGKQARRQRREAGMPTLPHDTHDEDMACTLPVQTRIGPRTGITARAIQAPCLCTCPHLHSTEHGAQAADAAAGQPGAGGQGEDTVQGQQS